MPKLYVLGRTCWVEKVLQCSLLRISLSLMICALQPSFFKIKMYITRLRVYNSCILQLYISGAYLDSRKHNPPFQTEGRESPIQPTSKWFPASVSEMLKMKITTCAVPVYYHVSVCKI